MKTLAIPGGWYCGARPDGSYVALIRDSHLETSEGRISLSPAGNVLELVLGPQRRFAGHGHNDVNVWEWVQGWQNRGVGEGQNCCVYDASGQLQIIRSTQGAPTGSQGWRYVDLDTGRLVPSDERPLAFGLNQPVSVGRGIWIGQGHDGGGVKVWDGSRLRVLAPGACYAIRALVAGDVIALGYYDVSGSQTTAHLAWATYADLLALPLDTAPAPPPQPEPQPEPPMPDHPNIPDCKDLLDAAWAAYPDRVSALLAASDAYEEAQKQYGAGKVPDVFGRALSDAKGWWCSMFATACGQRDARFGQRRKESGTNYRRADGTLVSTDVLMWKDDGQIIDTLSDRGYGWGINWGDRQPVDQWVAPLTADVPGPTENPNNSGDSDSGSTTSGDGQARDFSAVLARLDVIAERQEAIEQALAALLGKPAPTYSGSAKLGFNMTFTLEPQQ